MERLWKVLISPREIFDQIREHPPFLVPLLCILMLGGVSAATVLFHADETTHAIVAQTWKLSGETISATLSGDEDLVAELAEEMKEFQDWVVEGDNLHRADLDVTDEEIAQARFWSAVIALFTSAIGTMIVLLILGTYYWVVAKVLSIEIGWPKWFGFACWAGLPYGVGYVVQILLVSLGGEGASNALAPLTWFGLNTGWAAFLDIPLFWSVYLAIHGYQSWTSRDETTSVVVVALPSVLFAVGLLFFGPS